MIVQLRLANLICVLGLAGCSESGPRTDDAELNLRRIVQAYEQASFPRLPANVGDLKGQFKELGDKRDPEVILRSPRDGQPYVILFGRPLDSSNRTTILAYEKSGKDGKRYVVMLSRDIKLLTEEEFAAANFAGPRPDAK